MMQALSTWHRTLFRRGFLILFVLVTLNAAAGQDARFLWKHTSDQPELILGLRTVCLQMLPRGSVQLFTGFEFVDDWEAPLSRFRGPLYLAGMLRFDFYVSSYVSIKITGVLQEFQRIQGDPDLSGYDVKSDVANDIGDFSVATVVTLLSQKRHRPAVGMRIETKLPNTNQEHGLGPNTTDVTLSLLASHRAGSLIAFGDMGVGILTAPRLLNEQNDVFVYGFGFIWKLSEEWRIAGEVNGFVSTRLTTPVGTESRGYVRLGCVWSLPRLAVEVYPGYGLTGREGAFRLMVGLSWKAIHKT